MRAVRLGSDHDVGAIPRRAQADRQADAAAGAGDEQERLGIVNSWNLERRKFLNKNCRLGERFAKKKRG
jgi:hypothetical protein